jgi:hypothetical protein
MMKLEEGLSVKMLTMILFCTFILMYTKVLNRDIKVLKPTFEYYLYCTYYTVFIQCNVLRHTIKDIWSVNKFYSTVMHQSLTLQWETTMQYTNADASTSIY